MLKPHDSLLITANTQLLKVNSVLFICWFVKGLEVDLVGIEVYHGFKLNVQMSGQPMFWLQHFH